MCFRWVIWFQSIPQMHCLAYLWPSIEVRFAMHFFHIYHCKLGDVTVFQADFNETEVHITTIPAASVQIRYWLVSQGELFQNKMHCIESTKIKYTAKSPAKSMQFKCNCTLFPEKKVNLNPNALHSFPNKSNSNQVHWTAHD